MPEVPRITLYHAYRSSCSGRLRIALALKKLDYEPITLRLAEGDQQSNGYSTYNPSRTVPCLIIHPPDRDEVVLPQSIAALEYLDEVFPSPPLLPSLTHPARRAKVRQLVAIIACDTQPLQNRKIFAKIASLGGSPDEWAREVATRGLHTLEEAMQDCAGGFCVGDELSMADVCLAPQVWNAQIYGVKVKEECPIVWGVFERLMEMEAFRVAHWRCQDDCPEEFRGLGNERWPEVEF